MLTTIGSLEEGIIDKDKAILNTPLKYSVPGLAHLVIKKVPRTGILWLKREATARYLVYSVSPDTHVCVAMVGLDAIVRKVPVLICTEY